MFKDATHAKRSSQILKVLGNPHRLQILTVLLEGEKNVSEINQHVKVSQPALSQHLSRLRQKGLLNVRRVQRQMFYQLSNPSVTTLLGAVYEVAQEGATDRRAGQI